jgi:hypothetical protein
MVAFLCRNDVVFNYHTFLSYADHLTVYPFAPFMVISTKSTKPKLIHEGAYIVEGHNEIFSSHMDDMVIHKFVLHHHGRSTISTSMILLFLLLYFSMRLYAS